MEGPRLLTRVREACRRRHFSWRTEQAYVHWIRRFILFHGRRHPAEMGAPEVTAFLTDLAACRRVAASTQNQALSALLFLYREVLELELPWLNGVQRAPRRLRAPVVLTRAEVDALVDVARCYLSGIPNGRTSTADSYQVIVHVDGTALQGERGRSDVPVASVKRLCCDGSVVAMVDGADGEPLNVGRKQRTVPAALKRGRCGRATVAAAFPAARIPASWMPTTCVIGPTAGRRVSRTQCCFAAGITGWRTKVATAFAGIIVGGGISDGPTAGPFRRTAIGRRTRWTGGCFRGNA